MKAYRDRIGVDPAVVHGKPVILGTRIPVYVVLNLLAGGMRIEEVLGEYPDLRREDVLACIQYAADLAEEEVGVFDGADNETS